MMRVRADPPPPRRAVVGWFEVSLGGVGVGGGGLGVGGLGVGVGRWGGWALLGVGGGWDLIPPRPNPSAPDPSKEPEGP